MPVARPEAPRSKAPVRKLPHIVILRQWSFILSGSGVTISFTGDFANNSLLSCSIYNFHVQPAGASLGATHISEQRLVRKIVDRPSYCQHGVTGRMLQSQIEPTLVIFSLLNKAVASNSVSSNEVLRLCSGLSGTLACVLTFPKHTAAMPSPLPRIFFWFSLALD